VVSDAARLLKEGELVVFGSAALAYWLGAPPASRDVDVWCAPAERGDVLEALMGELSWYHEKHGTHVEVWGPETFKAPPGWRSRAKEIKLEAAPGVRVVAAHPHDVLIAKLERMDPKDAQHQRLILEQLPLSRSALDALIAEFHPGERDADREARFQANLAVLRARLTAAA
jgi:hypothetical protein